jgi:hypothetical protein
MFGDLSSEGNWLVLVFISAKSLFAAKTDGNSLVKLANESFDGTS